ncbi:zinc-binding dehydrogenase [uncultured Dysgonomonas sp.]|uniref:Enoyl reductase (ER) domain-containing protein n=1 Tax=uncultured Dysgonomonas sp. TaxID=206096 RepID=A0A212K3Y2_9BACT|nr:zinc-binding dehydrogenase [uncultured Dysgonomonas sp.]SBW06347.1 conserved hypothetical protein [uncultured Dysgonomonas sp.]
MDIIAKSWCWQQQGKPTDLILKEKRIGELGDDEVLVRNTVIGLNPVDWKLIEYGYPQWSAGFVPGVDAAGIVLAVGGRMTHIRVGARVCYHTDLSKDGSFSTHTIVPGYALMHIPDKVSDFAAASFPCPSLTAWQAFRKVPDMKNRNVLVSGAGGSVGYFLTQLLLHTGARVYVTAGTKHHTEFQEMGVREAIDYKDTDWKDKMISTLQGNLFDAVFDTVNGSHAASLSPLLGYYGHLIAIQDRVEKAPLSAFTTCISLHEIALGAIHRHGSRKQIAELMQDGEILLDKIGNGTLKLRQQSVDNFDNLPLHLAEMKKNNTEVKYIIKVL